MTKLKSVIVKVTEASEQEKRAQDALVFLDGILKTNLQPSDKEHVKLTMEIVKNFIARVFQ